jgi:hypothetical protein
MGGGAASAPCPSRLRAAALHSRTNLRVQGRHSGGEQGPVSVWRAAGAPHAPLLPAHRARRATLKPTTLIWNTPARTRAGPACTRRTPSCGSL